MKYDIQYRIKPKRRGGFLWGRSSLFPILDIRYRTKGSKRWIGLGRAEIDWYTYHRFKNTYYKDFEKSTTELMTLELRSDYDRLTLFMDIIKAEFDGSIDKFVASIVYEDITMVAVDNEEHKDVNRMALPLVTNGWRTLERTIGKQGEK